MNYDVLWFESSIW
uniref:Uncharacterized protein n=1 Tax=Arundo donax TaxID=35708 RepID=A0A0A9BD85_ARUDO